MNEPSSRGADSAVRDLANPIVAEVPSLVRLHADDVTLPELVERAHEHGLFEIACPRQEIELKVAADGGGDFCRRARFVGEERKPRGNNRLHARQLADGGRARLSRQLHAAAFDDEERMAFRVTERAGLRRLVQRALGDRTCEQGGRCLVERAECDRRQQIVMSKLTEQSARAGDCPVPPRRARWRRRGRTSRRPNAENSEAIRSCRHPPTADHRGRARAEPRT